MYFSPKVKIYDGQSFRFSLSEYIAALPAVTSIQLLFWKPQLSSMVWKEKERELVKHDEK